jgi:hypothetical protein
VARRGAPAWRRRYAGLEEATVDMAGEQTVMTATDVGTGEDETKMNSVDVVHAHIEKELGRRDANRVRHGHPSPTLWLERDIPVAHILEEGARARGDIGKALGQ